MANVTVNQSLLQISLDTGTDISAATNVLILYKKPSGQTGEWDGTVSSGTKIVHSLDSTYTLNEPGVWRLQGKFTIGGLIGYTDPVNMRVNKLFE